MSNFEIEAHEALILARATLKKSEENLAEAEKFHDAMLTSNQQLTNALGMLLPKSLTPEMPNDEDALTTIEEQSLRIKDAVSLRDYMDILYSIQMLAVANRDVIDILVELRSGDGAIDIDVHKKVDGEYSHENRLFNLVVYFDLHSDEENRNKLSAAESQIVKIIAQIREGTEDNTESSNTVENEPDDSVKHEGDEVGA